MKRCELLSSASAKHLVENAIEYRQAGKRKAMRRDALEAIRWYRQRSRGFQLGFFTQDKTP